MSNSVSSRSFLVGCPRSGTTLLQSMLMSHPRMHSFPETHFFVRAYGRRWVTAPKPWKSSSRFSTLLEKVRSDLATVGAAVEDVDEAASGSPIDRFVAILDHATLSAGKDAWVEKTPGHIYSLPLIRTRVPQARIIHLVRDGRATVASLFAATHDFPTAWGGPWSLGQCVAEWNRCLSLTARNAKRYGDVLVFYERLVRQPEHELTQICSALGLSYDSAMLQNFHETAHYAILQDEPWKAQNVRPLHDAGLEKYNRIFTDKQRQTVEASLNLDLFRSIFTL